MGGDRRFEAAPAAKAIVLATLLGGFVPATSVGASPGEGEGVIHKVERDGETYSDIAEHYYGKGSFAHHLKLFNGRGEPLSRGMSIIIPTYGTIALKRGQSLADFAEAHLSDASRAEYLAELHDLKGKDRTSPRPGTLLRAVPSLKHVVRPGETLRSIARVYYRDGARAERVKLVALYNKLSTEPGALAPGTHLRIPLDEAEFSRELVRARAKVPFGRREVADGTPPSPGPLPESEGAPSAKRLPKRRSAPSTLPDRPIEAEKRSSIGGGKEVSGALRRDPSRVVDEIERLCGEGRFEECESRAGAAFDATPPGGSAERAEILRQRAIALIALGRVEESKATFRLLLAIEPDYELDLYRTSPKVLDVFQAVAER